MTDLAKFMFLYFLALVIACASPFVLGVEGVWPKVGVIFLVLFSEIGLGFWIGYQMEKRSERP
jgi:hypothetical protein